MLWLAVVDDPLRGATLEGFRAKWSPFAAPLHSISSSVANSVRRDAQAVTAAAGVCLIGLALIYAGLPKKQAT